MKKWMICLLLPLAAAALFAAQDTDEIVIEMDGGPSVLQPQPTLWDRSAAQLTRQWRGKTREQVLYDVPVVSDRDLIVRGPTAEYALVEYDYNYAFRKFLFRAESPQTLLAVAATAAEVLAINKKYQINIGLSQKDFETFYKGKLLAQQAPELNEQSALYCLDYTNANTPVKKQRCFLFENKKLTQTFESVQDKDQYLAQKRQAAQEQAQKRAEQEAAQEAAQRAQAQAQEKNNPPVKALLYGGTAYDQSYMPRVTASPFLPKTENNNANK